MCKATARLNRRFFFSRISVLTPWTLCEIQAPADSEVKKLEVKQHPVLGTIVPGHTVAAVAGYTVAPWTERNWFKLL